MEDIIDIIVTETTNLIEITSQPTDEIIDVNIIDNREDVTLNVTPTVVEININSLTGNFGINWGEITGTLSNQTDLNTTLGLKADLVGGKVPSSQLPSYVDDVVEVANYAALPATGETGKIYITIDTNYIYRWTGSVYVEIKDSSAVWGAITGTLSNQTDLQNALNAKDAVLTFSSPLSRSTNTVSIPAATTSVNGYLTSTDWTTFNAKQAALSGTGFVKISGTTISYDNSDYLPTTLTTTAKTVLLNGQQFSIYGNSGGVFTSGRIIVDDSFGAVGYQVSGVFYGLKIDTSGNAYFDNSGTTRFYNSVRFDSTLTNGTYTYTLPGATGTLALTSDLSSLISGSGTSGIVPKFTGTGSIGNSQIYDNGTRVSIGADVTTINRFTAVSSTTSAYAVVAQASSAAHGIWSNVLGTGEIFRGQTAGGSYFIINNGGNAFLNGNLNVGDFASTSYRLNVVGTANFTGALSGTSATFSGNVNLQGGATRNLNFYDSSNTNINAQIQYDQITSNTGQLFFGTNNGGTFATRFTIASTGAATFSSSVTATSLLINGTDSSGAKVFIDTAVNGLPATSGTSQPNAALRLRGGDNAVLDFGLNSTNTWIQATDRSSLNNFYNILLNPRGGNVGIGTTSPSYGLDLQGSSAASAYFNITRTGYSSAFLQPYTDGVYFGSFNSYPLIIATNNTERMRITSGFSVSVPNNTATTLFDIDSVLSVGATAIVTVYNSTSGVGQATLLVQKSSAGNVTQTQIGTQPVANYFIFTLSGTNLQITTLIGAGTRTIKGSIIIIQS